MFCVHVLHMHVVPAHDDHKGVSGFLELELQNFVSCSVGARN